MENGEGRLGSRGSGIRIDQNCMLWDPHLTGFRCGLTAPYERGETVSLGV